MVKNQDSMGPNVPWHVNQHCICLPREILIDVQSLSFKFSRMLYSIDFEKLSIDLISVT